MNIITKLLLITVLGLSFSCQPKENKITLQKSKFIIAGKVELADNSSKVISISSNDLIIESEYVQTIDSNGFFKFEFDILYPHEVYLDYEKGRAVIFTNHKDSLFVNLGSEEFKKEQFPEYEISGKNAKLSNEIKSYNRFRKLDYFKHNCKDKTPQKYLADLDKYLLLEDSVISEFCRLHNPSDAFQKWAQKNHIFFNSCYLVNFEFQHFMDKTSYEGNIFDNTIFPVNDDQALLSSSYNRHLRNHAIYTHFQKNLMIQSLIKEEKYEEAYDTCLRHIKNKEEDGISREIMSYLMIKSAFKEHPEAFLKLVENSDNYLSNPVLIGLLKEKKENLENQNKFKISLLNLDKEHEIEGDFLSQLTKKHKGKVIYLDVWAAWCSPCRSEMSHAIKLHKDYHGKDITFVNLCLASDRTAWKKTINNLKIDGENYFFDEDQSKLIKSKLQVSGFPTYMIIDQAGNIVENKAPRPSSDQKIKKMLNQLLNKKETI